MAHSSTIEMAAVAKAQPSTLEQLEQFVLMSKMNAETIAALTARIDKLQSQLDEFKNDAEWRIDELEEESADPDHLPDLILQISQNVSTEKDRYWCCYRCFGKNKNASSDDETEDHDSSDDETKHHDSSDDKTEDHKNQCYWCQVVVAFLLSIGIQAFQIVLAWFLFQDAKSVGASQVGKWISQDLLQWTNATNATGFEFEQFHKSDDEYEIDVSTYVHDDIVVATKCDIFEECGLSTGLWNILAGIFILYAFLIRDVIQIFFTSKYKWMDRSTKWDGVNFILSVPQVSFGSIVLAGQVTTNVFIAVACGTKIVSSSLELTETLAAAVEAFFVLEIDDALLPFLVQIIQPKGSDFRLKHRPVDTGPRIECSRPSHTLFGCAKCINKRAEERGGDFGEQCIATSMAVLYILFAGSILGVPLVYTVVRAVELYLV